MAASPARVAAFTVLTSVEAGTDSSAAISRSDAELNLADRGLCREIVFGVLREQFLFNKAIAALTDRRQLDAAVAVILRMSLYQLWRLDRIPDHAVVSDAVDLTRRARLSSASGFVNAVLRRAIREELKDELLSPTDLPEETSHPAWLIDKWARDLGEERAASIARANNSRPAIAFRLTEFGLDHGSDADLEDQEIDAVAGIRDAYKASRWTRKIQELSERGSIYVQDIGSILIADSLAVGEGSSVLDVCGSPGGKISRIAAIAKRKGLNAQLITGDVSPDRIKTLRDLLLRQGSDRIGIVRYNAERALPFAGHLFSSVLVDAPCTGTGTIKHNPEIRYRVTNESIRLHSDKQLRILESASKCVAEDGELIYSTCSLEPEENEQVIARFMEKNAGFGLRVPVLPKRFITSEGFARSFPDDGDMDGYFVSRLVRVSS
ncbi:MAG: hypothetical protein KF736_12435 [Acidobacteria bacterium]|nr:hypothetical protein [Acidobacteriota bacterium]MCW5950484.1 hypothetical protein [Pyrinomonadaceae bacterium]